MSHSDRPLMAYCTCPNLETARGLAAGLVQEQLAACVNIVPTVESVYVWQGQAESDQEVLLLIKTLQGALQRLSTYIIDHHPYELPEVVAVPIEGGHPDYLDWVRENVSL